MTTAYVELFTPSRLREPDEGRLLVDALGDYLPSWVPHRYGWSKPLRHVYDPARFDHFWSQAGYWRNAAKTAQGSLAVRTGPWDLLSKVEVSGEWTPELTGEGLGAFLAACGAGIDVFGPPYAELFGVERLRSAPAAVVREIRPGYFYLQLTDDITDRTAVDAARPAVKAHLGADCFHDPAATAPRRAPRFTTAAEEGLWKPVRGTRMTEELRALLAKAPADES